MNGERRPEVVTCRVCGHREQYPEFLHLHLGRAHGDSLDADETRAFAAAVAGEEAWLLAARRHVKAGLAVLPIVLFYFFMVILILTARGNVALVFMGLPGIVAFSAFVYFLVFTRDRMPAVPGRAPPLETPEEHE